MFENIIKFSIRHPWLILALTLSIAVFGCYSYTKLPIDAVPDITNVQVQINTEAIGYTPLEVEQRITYPIETAISGLPQLDHTRSLSRYGLSQVTVIFDDGTDIYFARQLINERLLEARENLPEGLVSRLGPISSGLGEIFMYTVHNQGDQNKYSLSELRTIQDRIIKPQLRNTRGVAEVNTIGGYEKQYHVTPYLEKLHAYNLSFDTIIEALTKNNSNVGAGYIERNGEQYLVRSPGQLKSIEEVATIVVSTHHNVPVFLKDVAKIALGQELRTGAATKDGEEVVLGTVFMLMGENSRSVSERAGKKLQEINRGLPEGAVASSVYDRTELINATIATVKRNLFEGAVLVIAVLFLFLGNIKAALIASLVIPLSMLFTITGMVTFGVTGNLMSLGAIDFGLIVDGAVIIVENCIRRLAVEQHTLGRRLTRTERFRVVFEASKEVRQATMFGESIIMIVYLPILTLAGVEGKLFHPMAYTVILALLAAMIFSVTFVPAAVALLVTGSASEKEGGLITSLKNSYERILTASLRFCGAVVGFAIALVGLAIVLASSLGSEFVPSLDEGDIALHAMRIPGTSLTQAVEMQHALEKKLKEIQEVKTSFGKIGTAEIATDPMPPSVTDGFVMLKPRSEWSDPSKPKEELIHELEDIVSEVPGNNYEFTQPIEMRFNELIAGVRSDVAVKVFGDDIPTLVSVAQEISKTLERVPGSADVKVEQITGLSFLSVVPNREQLARYGLSITEVQRTVEIAIGGMQSGEVIEGDLRVPIVVRLPEELRGKITSLKEILIPVAASPENRGLFQHSVPSIDPEASTMRYYIPLGEVAEVELSEGPNQISRENGKRRIVVSANVRGRPLGSFVEEAEIKIRESVKIPPGYWTAWGGQFEQLISAQERLRLVIPVALFLIFAMLYMTFGTVKESILVFTGIPLALTGGVIALWIRGIPFSISAAIGFIALSGVAVLNGIVMITFIKRLVNEGTEFTLAIIKGSIIRLRPVLMTALVASLGFVPMAISNGTGSEVQKPLATVVIGGIISSTLLTLLVLPALYKLFGSRKAAIQGEEF